MNADFTDKAYDSIRALAREPEEAADIARLLATVQDVADHPDHLRNTAGVVRIGKRDGSEVYVVQTGNMRAILTLDGIAPSNMVVAGVFRNEHGEAAV